MQFFEILNSLFAFAVFTLCYSFTRKSAKFPNQLLAFTCTGIAKCKQNANKASTNRWLVVLAVTELS